MPQTLVELTTNETTEFQRVVDHHAPGAVFSVSAARFAPDFGPTTEVVAVVGLFASEYARAGGAWVAEFERDCVRWLPELRNN